MKKQSIAELDKDGYKMTLIKRRVEFWYISGKALKAQRLAAGLSQQALADLIKAASGIEINVMKISRMERAFEFSIEPELACVIQKILT
jgi:hypothetical protein